MDVQAIRTPNNHVVVRWFVDAETIIIYGGTDPDHIDTDEPLIVTSDENSVTLRNLPPAQRYYFLLVFAGGDMDGKRITVAEREIPFEGTVNFRDIGGYRTVDGRRVRWGKVFRAGDMSQLTEADHAKLQHMRLHTVCDLRTDEERIQSPDHLPENITQVALPVKTSEPIAKQIRSLIRYRGQMHNAVIDAYTRIMVDGNATVFAGVFVRLADPDHLPLAFHCAAGKDRTGITAALLLEILGVPDAIILADYSLSNRYVQVYKDHSEKMIRPLKRIGMTENNLQPLFTADPKSIEATLHHIRTHYGSVEAYLINQAGLSPDILQRVKHNLLES